MRHIAGKLLLVAAAAAFVSACGGGYGKDRPNSPGGTTYMVPPNGS